MRIASTTKHFTCLALLLLCEKGNAEVDGTLGHYLPELHPVAREVTLRQLMSNTGGLRDAHDLMWQFLGRDATLSSEELLSLYRDIADVNEAPGRAWIYSNGGFLLLTAVIERITGRSLETVLRESVLNPAGLYDTSLSRDDARFAMDRAALHMTDATSKFRRSFLDLALAGEGGLLSTVDDLLRWLTHMNEPVIGTRETWSMLLTPQALRNGISTSYGLGLVRGRYRGIETISHAGGLLGGNCQMLKVPAAGLDVAVISNRHDVLGMLRVNQILDACLPDLDPVPTNDTAAPPRASGVYCSPTTGRTVRLFVRDGQQMAALDGSEIPVVPDDEGVLVPPGIFDLWKYSLTLDGDPWQPTSVRLSDFGNEDELLLAKPAPESPGTAVEGDYTSDATGIEITIFASADGLELTSKTPFGSARRQLKCLAEGVWQMGAPDMLLPAGGILSFRDSDTFDFSSVATRSLHFRRSACRH
jgi:CubicO group peptidase (beta-lactamase class C family)